MVKTIRWGILSTGDIAGAFARDLKLLPDAELVAVGSRTQQRAEAFGQDHGIPHRHGSYEALAQDPDVDVIYVATPHSFHAENTILCLNSGKAVLCEKAFALNSSQAKEMIDLAREKKLFLMEAMVTRHFPVIKQVRQWVEEGRIGEVRMVQATRCADGVYPPEGRHMNLNIGGGSLLDVGIYVLSFCSMFFEEPPFRVQGSAHFEETGADGQGSIVLQYPNGALGSLCYALKTKGEDSAHVYGSHGRIHVHTPFWAATQATLIVPGEEDETVEIPKGETD
ncbi:MAG: Gfo/Idh/MocA family oxidoreductase [Candidatus Omnitrophica bacterium]|nr:Gfo/Idh/MocA family oxidoreductase [Candidatus Omnitrophota bacterium]